MFFSTEVPAALAAPLNGNEATATRVREIREFVLAPVYRRQTASDNYENQRIRASNVAYVDLDGEQLSRLYRRDSGRNRRNEPTAVTLITRSYRLAGATGLETFAQRYFSGDVQKAKEAATLLVGEVIVRGLGW